MKSLISKKDWQDKEKKSISLMLSRNKIPKVLIEVAAQHPLEGGELPGAEFQNRLNLGIELYKKEKASGNCVEIFVPGSRHQVDGQADKISLSKAGCNYLLEKGISKDDIRGEDLIKKYKGDQGVYNSGDECFVAAAYFKDNGFGQLYSVCSPAQVMRKGLNYIWNGVMPLFYTAPVPNMFHSFVGEAYDLIPYTRDVDPDAQDPKSKFAIYSRKRKVPSGK